MAPLFATNPGMFSLTMLGSGSAGNAALIATDHCKLLVDGGLSARQLVVRLELCGVKPEQLDGVLLTHEHGDHVCGLEVLCRKFRVRIDCKPPPPGRSCPGGA